MPKDTLAKGFASATFIPENPVSQETWDQGFKNAKTRKQREEKVWGGCWDCDGQFHTSKEFHSHIPTCTGTKR